MLHSPRAKQQQQTFCAFNPTLHRKALDDLFGMEYPTSPDEESMFQLLTVKYHRLINSYEREIRQDPLVSRSIQYIIELGHDLDGSSKRRQEILILMNILMDRLHKLTTT